MRTASSRVICLKSISLACRIQYSIKHSFQIETIASKNSKKSRSRKSGPIQTPSSATPFGIMLKKLGKRINPFTPGPYGPMRNTIKFNFSGGKVQNIVNVLMAVFKNSLRFHSLYLTMLPPEKCRFIWF